MKITTTTLRATIRATAARVATAVPSWLMEMVGMVLKRVCTHLVNNPSTSTPCTTTTTPVPQRTRMMVVTAIMPCVTRILCQVIPTTTISTTIIIIIIS